MGTFATFVYSDGGWDDHGASERFLSIDIHDSDIATLRFAPAESPARGLLYLGYEPRHYFEDPSASDPVDVVAETDALIAWAADVTGVLVASEEVIPFLASPDGDEPGDVFVEETVAQLLKVIGLLPPPDLDVEDV
ncbi:hypothetical protein E1212_14505 [Jiangella ureilytica]|uniref:Uncharacterized protein n=1 Tax=Jiangella ureilytica TaxID=2530374 RepID=A0A4R4RLK6_9ACTN|nr:hypothetical protein [Jiangella ureilytica]TDC50581.1 hypothetical protein E1212_14505 [Jiangella ureilytica]